MRITRTEPHEYKGQKFDILFDVRDEKYQTIYLLFKTPFGTWQSNLRVAIELMEKEPKWKDYMCEQALTKYEKRNDN